jgi:hypothetical protein
VIGLAALTVAAFGLAATRPPQTAPAFSVAVAKEAKPVLGIVGDWRDSQLVRLDPRSLRPLRGPKLDIFGSSGAWAFSPDRSRLAIGTACQAGVSLGTLQLVDIRRMRAAACFVIGGYGGLRSVAWPTPTRVLAVTHSPLRVVLIDARARRVIQKTPLEGFELMRGVPAGERLVLLTGRTFFGEAHQVVVADSGGSVQFVDVVVPSASDLVVDPSGRRAYLVSADTVAEIDLGKLAVTYHELRSSRSALGRTLSAFGPAARAKTSRQETRGALWLGGGLIASFGSDVTYDGRRFSAGIPLGLTLIDTRDWTMRMIDEHVTSALLAGDVLLATGTDEIGLVAYDLNGTRRFQLFRGRSPVVPLESYGDKAWINVGRPSELSKIVNVRTGRVVGSGPLPTLLVGR